MRSCGYEICVGNGGGVQPGGHETSYVGDVRQQQRPAILGNPAHSFEVYDSWIGGGSNGNQLGFFSPSYRFNRIVIDATTFRINAVIHYFVKKAAAVLWVPVSEMAAILKAHS